MLLIYRDYESKPDAFVTLLSEAEKPLYSGCSKFIVLSALEHFVQFENKTWLDMK